MQGPCICDPRLNVFEDIDYISEPLLHEHHVLREQSSSPGLGSCNCRVQN